MKRGMHENKMMKKKLTSTWTLSLSNQFKEICFKNDKPLNIIKLATLDHIEWTAVNNADTVVRTTATIKVEHV